MKSTLSGEYVFQRDDRDSRNAKAALFALRLRISVYKVKTSQDFQGFSVDIEAIGNSGEIALITQHLLEPDATKIEISSTGSLQQTRIPDVLWFQNRKKRGLDSFCAIGRASFRNDSHGFPKQLSLPRTAL